MPTLPLMQIPKSKSSVEFESICKDILSIINNITFVPYGRNGQKQDGIDIYSKVPKNDDYIVAQCKNYFDEKSADRLIKNIKKDINASSQLPFYNAINKFIVMTSMNINNKVQNEIESIKSQFDIEIWFWDEIQEVICKNEYLLYIYYPHIYYNFKLPINISNEIISNTNTLKHIAEYFLENYQNYRVSYNRNSDIDIYNKCVEMINASISLCSIKDKYYLQIKNLDILKYIEQILKFMPRAYDASNDDSDANMIVTIHNYIEYFCIYDNNKNFIEKCKYIISKLS